MALKAAVLSDLHLGEPGSILFNQRPGGPHQGLDFEKHNAINELADLLRDTAREEGKEEKIDELILIGDILDLALDGSPNFQRTKENTRELLKAIHSKVKIGKVVFVVGNHDYQLWVKMVKEETKTSYKNTSKKINYSFSEEGDTWKVNYKPFKNNLFQRDYTDGSFPVEVTYPIYSLYNAKSFYLFHHGHLDSPLLINPGWVVRFFFSLLTGLSQPKKAKDLGDLEERVWKRTSLLWGRYWKPYEWLWKRVIKPALIFSRLGKKLRPGSVGTLYMSDQLGVDEKELQKEIRWFINLAAKIPLRHIDLSDVEFKFHYVFGHTHYGGKASEEEKLCWVERNGQRKYVSTWNLGGWTVPWDIYPPYGYVFFIRDDWSPGRSLLYSSKFKNIRMGFYPSKILAKHAKARSIIG